MDTYLDDLLDHAYHVLFTWIWTENIESLLKSKCLLQNAPSTNSLQRCRRDFHNLNGGQEVGGWKVMRDEAFSTIFGFMAVIVTPKQQTFYSGRKNLD